MSQEAWRPVRVGEGEGGTFVPATFIVDLVVYNEDVKRIFEGIISNYPELRIKDPEESSDAQLVILELDEDPSESFTFIETVVQAVDGREVFLTSPRTDSTVLLEAIRAGTKEFFPQPIQAHDVETALSKFITRCQLQKRVAPQTIGKILCLLGGKGGVGTTTAAVNIGLALCGGVPGRSIVVELNQHGGDLAIFLDVQTNHSLRDIGSDLSRLDISLLKKVLTKHSSGMFILPSGYDDLTSGRLHPDAVEPILRLLQAQFEYVVLDCGHVVDLTVKKAMEMASTIMMVSTLIVPVVHRTKRILDLLRNSKIDGKKIRVVFNRYATEEQEVLRETEEALRLESSMLIPNDYPTASSAINTGTPIVMSAPRTPIARVFTDIVDILGYGFKDKKEQGNWMGRLRGMISVRGASKPVPAP